MIARCSLVVLLTLALAAPALGASGTGSPEELWRAYPLGPETTSSGSPSEPLTPPVQRELPPSAIVAIVPSDDGGAFPWWLIGAATLVASVVGVILVRRRLEAIPARAAIAAWRREPLSSSPQLPSLERFSRTVEAVAGPGPGAAVECVVRREGVVRSRFVAELEPQAGRERTIASSRSFWRRGGGAGATDKEARRAWDELIGGLEADGWQIAPSWGAREAEPRPEDEIPDTIQLVRSPVGAGRAEG